MAQKAFYLFRLYFIASLTTFLFLLNVVLDQLCRPSLLPTPQPSLFPTAIPTPIPTPAYCSSGYFARLDSINPARYNCTPCASGRYSNVTWNEGVYECTDW